MPGPVPPGRRRRARSGTAGGDCRRWWCLPRRGRSRRPSTDAPPRGSPRPSPCGAAGRGRRALHAGEESDQRPAVDLRLGDEGEGAGTRSPGCRARKRGWPGRASRRSGRAAGRSLTRTSKRRRNTRWKRTGNRRGVRRSGARRDGTAGSTGRTGRRPEASRPQLGSCLVLVDRHRIEFQAVVDHLVAEPAGDLGLQRLDFLQRNSITSPVARLMRWSWLAGPARSGIGRRKSSRSMMPSFSRSLTVRYTVDSAMRWSTAAARRCNSTTSGWSCASSRMRAITSRWPVMRRPSPGRPARWRPFAAPRFMFRASATLRSHAVLIGEGGPDGEGFPPQEGEPGRRGRADSPIGSRSEISLPLVRTTGGALRAVRGTSAEDGATPLATASRSS